MANTTRFHRLIELLLLFVLLPVVLFLFRRSIAHGIIFIIWIVSALCFWILWRDACFDNRAFTEHGHFASHLMRMTGFIAIAAVPVTVAAYLLMPERFCIFFKQSPAAWLGLILLYPVLAAYPQEIIFRGFFFHRYRSIFSDRRTMVVVSSLLFGFAHLLYGNWVAPLLSAAGGFLFAWRYLKSGSILIAGVEHALWGDFLFTIGVGWYFYSGAMK